MLPSARLDSYTSLDHGTVLLVAVFAKSEQENLTPLDKQVIAKVLRQVKDDLESGAL